MNVFHSTAEYYTRFRSGYPPELIAQLAASLGWDNQSRVLDLGCGSGQLAVPVSGYVAEVVAVDPDEAMLAQGQLASALVGATNIAWKQGDSTQLLQLDLGHLHAAMMGASFHWMDRLSTLETLDSLITPAGAVVLAGAGSPLGFASPPWWEEPVARLRERWLGPRRRAGSGTYLHPAQRHEEILAVSSFSDVHTSQWPHNVTRSLDEVIGLQLSYSYCAPALFGEEFPRFLAELRQTLLEQRPADGRYTCQETIEVTIARRPDA